MKSDQGHRTGLRNRDSLSFSQRPISAISSCICDRALIWSVVSGSILRHIANEQAINAC